MSPPIAADSAGTLVWREGWNSEDLVAVRDGKEIWRRRLSQPNTFPVSALIFGDKLFVLAFGPRLEAHRVSDGTAAWTRDVRVDRRPAQISTIARLGRYIVAAAAESDTLGWLTALRRDGRIAWRTRIGGPVARMASNRGQLSLLMGITRGGEPPPSAFDTNGKPTAQVLPRIMGRTVSGDEIVFDSGYAVSATIGPLPVNCPPQSPSCHPPPDVLKVAGYSADGANERWHYTGPTTGFHVQLVLLSDRSVLLVDTARVEQISDSGTSRQVCGLALSGSHWSLSGLIRGDLVIVSRDGAVAYTLPGAPRLAASGWVMRGGGPAEDWAVR